MAIGTSCAVAVAFQGLLDEMALLLLSPLDETCATVAHSFNLFTHPVRRAVLRTLAEDGTSTRDELASAVAAAEGVDGRSLEQLVVGLHHNHLPKLDDHHYLEYDPRMGDVVLRKDPDAVRALVDSANPGHDRRS